MEADFRTRVLLSSMSFPENRRLYTHFQQHYAAQVGESNDIKIKAAIKKEFLTFMKRMSPSFDFVLLRETEKEFSRNKVLSESKSSPQLVSESTYQVEKSKYVVSTESSLVLENFDQKPSSFQSSETNKILPNLHERICPTTKEFEGFKKKIILCSLEKFRKFYNFDFLRSLYQKVNDVLSQKIGESIFLDFSGKLFYFFD